VVRYREVALLAAALRDDVLSSSLNEIYLAPLAQERDGGATLRQTLRAYFAAERNVSSAAARLEVSRKTVRSRLRAIEQRVGRSLDACAAEMEIALRLQRLSDGQIQ
jgi:DNA-binding PucR family transcriptional regulator